MKDRYAYRDAPMCDSCDCWREQAECRSAHASRPRNPETCGLARLSDKTDRSFLPHGLTLGSSKAVKRGRVCKMAQQNGEKASWCLIVFAGTCLLL